MSATPGNHEPRRPEHREPRSRQDFDDWDAVFADPDPTRVLDPRVVHSVPDQEPAVSATSTAPVNSATPLGPAGPSMYARIQFIPACAGALVAYGLISGSLALLRFFFGSFNLAAYGSATEAVLAVTQPATQGAALPWVIALALTITAGFICAGYTTGRMSALAPGKQAVGVLAVTTLAVLLATLITWASSASSQALAPAIALQPLLAPNLPFGLLTTLALGLIGLIGALIGAGLGVRYHRKLGA